MRLTSAILRSAHNSRSPARWGSYPQHGKLGAPRSALGGQGRPTLMRMQRHTKRGGKNEDLAEASMRRSDRTVRTETQVSGARAAASSAVPSPPAARIVQHRVTARRKPTKRWDQFANAFFPAFGKSTGRWAGVALPTGALAALAAILGHSPVAQAPSPPKPAVSATFSASLATPHG